MLSPPMSIPDPTSTPQVNPCCGVLSLVCALAERRDRNVMIDMAVLFIIYNADRLEKERGGQMLYRTLCFIRFQMERGPAIKHSVVGIF